jgi:hypothetical protein
MFDLVLRPVPSTAYRDFRPGAESSLRTALPERLRGHRFIVFDGQWRPLATGRMEGEPGEVSFARRAPWRLGRELRPLLRRLGGGSGTDPEEATGDDVRTLVRDLSTSLPSPPPYRLRWWGLAPVAVLALALANARGPVFVIGEDMTLPLRIAEGCAGVVLALVVSVVAWVVWPKRARWPSAAFAMVIALHSASAVARYRSPRDAALAHSVSQQILRLDSLSAVRSSLLENLELADGLDERSLEGELVAQIADDPGALDTRASRLDSLEQVLRGIQWLSTPFYGDSTARNEAWRQRRWIFDRADGGRHLAEIADAWERRALVLQVIRNRGRPFGQMP